MKSIVLLLIVLFIGSCSKNTAEIAELRKKVTTTNEAEPKYKLANIYYKELKLARAKELYEEAAIKNHSKSQYILATMYANGEGGRVDNIRAWFWSVIAEKDAKDSNVKTLSQGLMDKLSKNVDVSQLTRAQAAVNECESKALAKCAGSDAYVYSILPIEP